MLDELNSGAAYEWSNRYLLLTVADVSSVGTSLVGA